MLSLLILFFVISSGGLVCLADTTKHASSALFSLKSLSLSAANVLFAQYLYYCCIMQSFLLFVIGFKANKVSINGRFCEYYVQFLRLQFINPPCK